MLLKRYTIAFDPTSADADLGPYWAAFLLPSTEVASSISLVYQPFCLRKAHSVSLHNPLELYAKFQ